MTPSAQALWQSYRRQHSDAPASPRGCFYFCDNPHDADLCADLVVRGLKCATAACVAELERADSPLPATGDLNIVTRWDGEAVAIIRTTRVEICPLDDVDAAFARAEGEGDGSLEWWRQAHEAYYTRVLAGSGITVDGRLPIVCEHFERVF